MISPVSKESKTTNAYFNLSINTEAIANVTIDAIKAAGNAPIKINFPDKSANFAQVKDN